MRRDLPLLALLPCLAFAGSLTAQVPPELVTDRPDRTESAAVVPRGFVQLEAGWTHTEDSEEGLRREVVEGPGTLLRIGLTQRVELRLGWDGWIDEEFRIAGIELSRDGSGDGEAGLKVLLAEGGAGRPALALLLSTSLPVADDGLGSEEFDPSAVLLGAFSLTPNLDLGFNLGAERVSEGDASSLVGVYTLALGRSLGERAGVFIELFGEVPEGGGGSTSVDGGFTWQLAPNFQLDLAAGAGLDDDAEDYFVGVGFSWRLPR